MITKFNQYINEGLRDQMKGKSEKEIEDAIKTASIESLLRIISSGKIDETLIPSVEEIKDRLRKEEPINRWIFLVTDKKSLGKYYPNDEDIEQGLKKLPMTEWITTVYYNNLDEKYYPTKEELEKAIKGDGKSKVYDVYSGVDAFEFTTKDGEKIYMQYISVIANSEIDAKIKVAKVLGQDYMTQYLDRDNDYENFIGSAEYKHDY